MTLKSLLFSPLLMLLCLAVQSQDHVDIVNASWLVSPNNDSRINTEDVTVQTQSLDLRVPLVLKEDKSKVILTGLSLKSFQFTPSNEGAFNTRYNSIGMQLGYRYQLTDRLNVLAMGSAKLSADTLLFELEQNLQLGGVLLLTRKQNERLSWQYGAYYNDEFFGPFVLPLIGTDWRINEQWHLKVLIPVSLDLARKHNDRMTTGLRFVGNISSFSVGVTGGQYLESNDNNLWLYNDLYLTKKLVLHLRAGHSILRSFRTYNDPFQVGLRMGPVSFGDDRPFFFGEELKNGFSFGGSLILRFPA